MSMNMKSGAAGAAVIAVVFAVTIFGAATIASAQYTHWTPFFDEWMNMKDVVPRGYVCHRIQAPITIDGNIEEAGWHAIPWTEYFVDIEGERKPVPWFRTQAKMAWDDDYFYVAADMEETDVWGTLIDRDAIIYWDNDFEIFIDPDSDNHHYYELEINALNTVWDLMLHIPYRDGGTRDMDWTIHGLKTAVQVHGTLNDPSKRDAGWSIEFAIPWTVLAEYTDQACPPKEGDLWRVDFSRVEYIPEVIDGAYRKAPKHRGENWVWSAPGVINMHCPERWGCVRFSSKEPGTVAYEPDPTEPARTILHTVYYAQREYHRANGRYADSIEALNVPIDTHKSVVKGPELTMTSDGFSASVVVKTGRKKQTISIRQDSKITVE